jgi:XTP/dITP diphosphohydrolase
VTALQVVLATRNDHKVAELRRILDDAGLDLELLGIDAFADVPEVAETGTTFAENALLKAHAVSRATGLPAVADDSGLCVDVLGGMPGVFSARWSGAARDDSANVELVLSQLDDIADDQRTASFVCAAAVATADGSEVVVEGRWPGELVREPRGTNGFGYDPIFRPDGEARTSAELESAEKDASSHRGRALRALVPILAQLAATGTLPSR